MDSWTSAVRSQVKLWTQHRTPVGTEGKSLRIQNLLYSRVLSTTSTRAKNLLGDPIVATVPPPLDKKKCWSKVFTMSLIRKRGEGRSSKASSGSFLALNDLK